MDLARELKSLWNIKVTVIPIIIGILGTILKSFVKGREELEIGGRAETIQIQYVYAGVKNSNNNNKDNTHTPNTTQRLNWQSVGVKQRRGLSKCNNLETQGIFLKKGKENDFRNP